MDSPFYVLPSQRPCEEEAGGFLGEVTLGHVCVNGGEGTRRIRPPV